MDTNQLIFNKRRAGSKDFESNIEEDKLRVEDTMSVQIPCRVCDVDSETSEHATTVDILKT